MSERPVIANLDFNDVKTDIVEYFKGREEFTDYEFTGSGLNLLMDILSYNTHYYSLASNFLLNESFLDTSILRKNVVSLSKQLNYTPHSVKSAFTQVKLRFTKQNENDNVVIIPAASTFTSSSNGQSLIFHTVQDYVLQFENSDAVGTQKTIDVDIYEGTYQTQAFSGTKDYTDFAKFVLQQDDIDTSNIIVSVNGTRYSKVLPEDETIFSLNKDSLVYFIEEGRDGGVVVIFGNGIVGKPIATGDQIVISYLTSNGADGNGIKSFTPAVRGRVDATIVGIPLPTQGGAAKESIQSIKDNAPKWFQSQYRAVTTNDYEVFLKKNFADIQSISVYGGEDIGQPGKVFICIKPKSADKLTRSTKEILKKEVLSSSKIVTVRPEFTDPNIFRLQLQTIVVYDESRLGTSRSILEAKTKNLFDFMNKNYIGDFLTSFRESNLSYEIKNLDTAIISSNTRVKISTRIKVSNQRLEQYTYRFNNKIYHPSDGFLGDKGGVFSSSPFYRVGRTFQSGFDEDGYGNIRLYDFIDGDKVYVNNKAGRINYETGLVEFLYDFDPQDTTITVSVVPDSVDVLATQNMLLEIDSSSSTVDAIEIKETDLLRNINLSRSI